MSLFANTSIRYFLTHPWSLLVFYFHIGWLKIKMILGLDPNLQPGHQSSLPIDVVMPTLDRDYDVVKQVIDSLRKQIKHPIRQILIISPPSAKIQKLCREKKCRWVNENNVIPLTIKDIHMHIQGINRSGWIFQQLLKWGATKYLKSKYFLVQESDTIYTRPHVFEQNGKIIFACSSELPHIPYFQAYQRLLGERAWPIRNLTSHHLLFSTEILQEVKQKIEKKARKPWYQAIIDVVDRNEVSSISDYDSYGQYVLNHYPRAVQFEHWANRSFNRSELPQVKSLLKEYSPTTKTLSFHSYNE